MRGTTVFAEFVEFDSERAVEHLQPDSECVLITVDHSEEIPPAQVGGGRLRVLDLRLVRFEETAAVGA